MTLLPLALKSLRNRRFAALLTLATIACSVALLLGVERVRDEARRSFASTVSGTDLIVGARSGPVNLLLYAVFHLGEANAAVSWASYQELAAQPEVAWAVPLSLGDSHRGFRVVGTSADFFTRYRYGAQHALEFSAGTPFADLYDAVIGADVADKLGYAPGTSIVLSHGIGSLAEQHADKPFRVVGVLARSGTPVDASVFIDLPAVEALHADWQSGTHLPQLAVSAEDARQMDLTPKSVSAILVGLKSRAAAFGLKRRIDEYRAEPLLAILPGVTLQELWQLVGGAENALRATSALVVVTGLLGMLTALVTTLNERRREMAVLRALGAPARTVFGLMLLEALLLTAGGALLGVLLLAIALVAGSDFAATHYGLNLTRTDVSAHELGLLAAVLFGGLTAGTIPAALAYRRALADGLSLRW
jgi:putative ABC transport system permease protein